MHLDMSGCHRNSDRGKLQPSCSRYVAGDFGADRYHASNRPQWTARGGGGPRHLPCLGQGRVHNRSGGADRWRLQRRRMAPTRADWEFLVPGLAETATGNPVTTEILRPGLRVTIVGLLCSPLMRTTLALKAVGPAAFGYDFPYVPLR